MPNEVRISIGRLGPQAGTEGRGSWVDKLTQLSQTVGGAQAANPPYMPFPAGTPTLGTNQLMEQARQNAANLALEQARLNQPKAPDAKALAAGVKMAGLSSALERWTSHLAELGLGPKEIPSNAKESEDWINKVLPGLTGGLYDQLYGMGGTTADAEGMVLDMENLLRVRAGLTPKPSKPDEGGALQDSEAYKKALEKIKSRK